MRIAVLNETSAGDKNAAILAALAGVDATVVNAGMRKGGEPPELNYLHTGLLAGLLLATGRADFVVGGCGTGQGFLNSVMQYPGVGCGLIASPLDAWLFSLINAGNCVSLALNKGFGWASEVNLRLLFDGFFSVEEGTGYPPARRESQQQSRRMLGEVSRVAHRGFPEIVRGLDEVVAGPVLSVPGVRELLAVDGLADPSLAEALRSRLPRQRPDRG
jgi:ribose 5-phosphate isomerase RpiB